MNVQTLSVIVGGQACNATCPFCISRMTPNQMTPKPPDVNWRRFETAIYVARAHGATTMMLTGKGEPTLSKDLISAYIRRNARELPIVELQTNGILLAGGKLDPDLAHWEDHGLTTVALSIVHWDRQANEEIYGSSYEVRDLVKKLHDYGLSVRLSVTMLEGYVDGVSAVNQMINFAKSVDAEQLTLTPVNTPYKCDDQTALWAKKHAVPPRVLDFYLPEFLHWHGTKLITLPHGATIFDVDGQNVCLSNCLTPAVKDGTMRNLIFHPDGHLRFDWTHEGSILL